MEEKMVVTPYDVKGSLNYDKLIKEFGLTKIKQLPDVFQNEVLFRRHFVFAHRDLQRILTAIKEKKQFIMMTGLMPTGKFHLGHAMVAQQFIFYQKLGAKVYIAVADIEAFTARGQSLEESKERAKDYIANYIALGLDPTKCEIYFQSKRSNSATKANAYYRLQNILSKHTTFNEFKAVYGEITPGKMLASLLQASDMLHAQLPEFEGACPVIIPVGPDQDPHIRIARDMASRIKTNTFIQLSSTYHSFLPGLKGGKMSASDENSYISPIDDPKTIKKKINKYAFSGGQATVEEHKKKGGNPDIDVSFQYLRFLEEDDKVLEQLYNNYKKGTLLTGELKKKAIDTITSFVINHQKKYNDALPKAKKIIDDCLA